VVLNNFNGTEDHVKLMNVTFQKMFPAIDVKTVQLSECRRVVLFNYQKETDTIEFRQYVIRAAPLGLSKSVKTIVKAKVPDLSKLDDISEYVLGNGAGAGSASDSEVDDEAAHVTLPDNFRGRGNQRSQKSAVRLTEIGPRLTLKLTKVEREVCEGDVLYHAYMSKTPEEAAKLKIKKEEAIALKRKRREEQEANVTRKKDEKNAKKARKLELKQNTNKTQNDGDVSDLDDAEYYRQEVGEEPDPYMFPDKKKQPSKEQPSKETKKTKLLTPKQPKGKIIRQRQPKKVSS
jgi:ribosome biogenesis protein SSF1/2